jgi:hypothetical protein
MTTLCELRDRGDATATGYGSTRPSGESPVTAPVTVAA